MGPDRVRTSLRSNHQNGNQREILGIELRDGVLHCCMEMRFLQWVTSLVVLILASPCQDLVLKAGYF